MHSYSEGQRVLENILS